MFPQPHYGFGLALIAALFLLLGIFLWKRERPTEAQRALLKPFSAPALAMEFADTPERAGRVRSAFGAEEIARGVEDDDRLIIPLYTVLFSAVAGLVFLRLPASAPTWAGLGAVALAVALVCAAAWFDQRRENPSLYRLLGVGPGGAAVEAVAEPAAELATLRRATTWKWALLFAAFVVIGLMAAARGGWLSILVMASYLLFAVVGFVGLFAPGQKALLDFAFNYLMGPPLFLTGIWLTRT